MSINLPAFSFESESLSRGSHRRYLANSPRPPSALRTPSDHSDALGPVRFLVDAKSQPPRRPSITRLIVRETRIWTDGGNRSTLGIQELYHALANTAPENKRIVDERVIAVITGRPLADVLTERKAITSHTWVWGTPGTFWILFRTAIVGPAGREFPASKRRRSLDQLASIRQRERLHPPKRAGYTYRRRVCMTPGFDTLCLVWRCPVSWRGR